MTANMPNEADEHELLQRTKETQRLRSLSNPLAERLGERKSDNPVSQVKGGQGCTGLNRTYEYEGVAFDIFCGTSWPFEPLYITYTVGFPDCMRECAQWNIEKTQKCVGVAWSSGMYGPRGRAGGSTCWFYWNMVLGDQHVDTNMDSGRLNLELPTITHPVKWLTILKSTTSIAINLIRPQPTDEGCRSINTARYKSTTGAEFDIFCRTNYPLNDLAFYYFQTFHDCINGCATWNTNATDICRGIVWTEGFYGPDGVEGGSRCFYKFVARGEGGHSISDTALLNTASVTVPMSLTG